MTNVYIVGGNNQIANMFLKEGYSIVEAFDSANLVVFTGGEDVSPSFYGEYKHRSTFSNPHRDAGEVLEYAEAKGRKLPCVGICRGAQFLNVMNNGKLYQDIDNHALGSGHMLHDKELNQMFFVTSTHHQQMRPHESGEVVAFASRSSYKIHMSLIEDGDPHEIIVEDDKNDVEVVYYPSTNDLCFQGHPEFWDERCKNYFFNVLNRKVGV